MLSAPSPNPIVGLVLPLVIIVLVLLSIRRAAKTRLVFHRCRICDEAIQFEFRRGIRAHMKEAHNKYWRWSKRWILIFLAVSLGGIFSVFPLLILNIIPSHTATAWTLIGIALWSSAFFITLGLLFAHQVRVVRSFKEEWMQQHPLYQRSYGNLRGIEAEIRKRSRAGSAAIPLMIIEPVSLVVHVLTTLVVGKKLRRVRLDKFEEGRIWFHNSLDMITSVELKNPVQIKLDEQRIRVGLKRGQLEIRTETSNDLELIRSVLGAGALQAPKP